MADQDFSLLFSLKSDSGAPAAQPDAAPAAVRQDDFSLLLSLKEKPQAADDGVFDSLLWQESRGRQTAADGSPITSKKGAIGIAQVMPGTAPEAARLAGVEFDDVRYRTDAEYNKALGKAYFSKQLQDFGGDKAKALAAYNAGPGALRRALERAEESGDPGAWLRFMPAETQAYVPAIIGRSGGAQQAKTSSRRDQYTNIQPAAQAPGRGVFGLINDSVIDAGNAAAGLVKSGISLFAPDSAVAEYIDKEIIKAGQDKQSDQKKATRAKLQSELAEAGIHDGSTSGEVAAEIRKAGVQFSHAITTDPVGTLSEAFGNLGPFAILGKGMQAAKFANGMKTAISSGVGAGLSTGEVRGNIWEKISGTPDAELQQLSPAYAELRKSGVSEEDAKRRVGAKIDNNLPELALVGLVGALSGKYGPEGLVTGVAPKYAIGRAGAAALGFIDEGPLQGGVEQVASNYGVRRAIPSQSLLENVGQNIVAEGMPGALMGGVYGGSKPAPVAVKPPAQPALPPELQPVAEKAQQPNSPLSRAAMAGNTPEVVAQRQAERAAQAGALDDVSAAETAPAQEKDPGARLAELEAIAKGAPAQQVTDDDGNPLTIPGEPGRFFTQEEKAEYDQLVAMKNATEEVRNADQPQVDEISARVDEISQSIRDNGTLQQMRESGEDVKGLLKDLAIAKSKSTRQDQREQAIARVEFALGWADQPTTAQAPTRQQADPILAALNDPAIEAQDREELSIAYQASKNPALPERTRQAALDRAREIVGRYAAPVATQPAQESTPAVLGDIPPQPDTPEEALRNAEQREAGAYQFKAEGYPDEAQALQQEADSLREEAAVRREQIEADTRVEQVAAPEVATPRGPGPAAIRKRKATLRQLVDNGLNRVDRRDDGFYLVSQNGRQEFKLDGMADAQLARAAVTESIRDGAALANTAPTEAQIAAGNYKTGVIKFDGIDLAVENPQGSTRSGTDPNGERWETVMPANYGYIRGSAMAADGDKVDIYLPDNARAGSPAWIIDQYNDDGSFDETKTVLGVRTEEEAAAIYDAGYSDGSGPRRRGAITQMPIEDFKAWAMSPAAKKPAGAPRAAPADIIQAAQRDGVEIDGTMRITVAGKPIEIGFVKELGKTESVSRGGRARRASKKQGQVLQAIAQAFGKEIKFFYETGSDVGDGFIMPNDPSTIYLNESSSLSPIVVFGHELMHQLKRDNPEAHAAVEAVVAKRMKTKKVQDAYGKLGYHNGQILEELVSDIGGDLMADSTFWSEVFDEVHANNDASAARKIIAKLAEFIARAINALSQNLRSYADTGAGSALVTDMDTIRAAFKEALAGYIQAQGISKPAMQAEILKAGQEAKRSAARRAEETENFSRWFGDSKVVDAQGNPLVVYHGTRRDVSAFDRSKIGSATDEGFLGDGFYFTDSKRAASAFANGEDGNVIPVYLSIKNPYYADGLLPDYITAQYLLDAGFDGVIYETDGSGDYSEYVALKPEQIKSAIGNNGDYSLTDPNITRSAQRDMFQEDMIDADAKVKTSRVVDSNGNTEDGGNVDSAGRQIAPTRQALENFWKWFGDSEAVDESGRPALYHHTTRNDFDQFEANRVTKNSGTFGEWEASRAAIFFTESLEDSQAYGKAGNGFEPGANVMPVYLKAENVLDMTSGYLPSYGKDAARIEEAGLNPRYMDRFDWSKFDDDDGKEMVDALKRAGYDAVKFWDQNPDTQEDFQALAVFSPEQIKSALGNRGTFDGSDANITRSADRSDALTVEAYHYSKQPRSTLTTGAFGTGLQGSDRDAIMAHPDQRLRQRLSFYVNKGSGVRPEAGVGGIAHKATLSNIYDGDADVKRLKQGRDRRGFESAVLDAGYSGYLERLEGTQPGQVILLGRQTVTPEVLGPRTNIPEAKVVPQPTERDMDIGDRINANKMLPVGRMDPADWKKYLQRLMPAEAAELDGTDVFEGSKAIYKDELVARIRKAAAPIASRARQTETPEFKAWFGDSKVVDADGEPLVVYHGGRAGLSEFKDPDGRYRTGIFFTSSNDMADTYGRGGETYAVYLSLQKPFVLDAKSAYYSEIPRPSQMDEFAVTETVDSDLIAEWAFKNGYDGVVLKNLIEGRGGEGDVYIASKGAQIKSATGNSGAFDPNDANITRSSDRSAREAKIEKLAPVAQRGERIVGQRVTLTADEKQAIEFSAETTGVSAKEITRVVREHKLAHPPAQGWAPLVFAKAKTEKGKLVYEYEKVPYSFNADQDGRALKQDTPEYGRRVGAVARRMADEVRRVYQRATAGDKNAENILAQAGWYKSMRARLRHEFGGLGDLFADLLGATSPNTPVRDNWSNAVDSLRRATRGDFDELIPAWEAWADAVDGRETELRAWFNEQQAAGKSKKAIKDSAEYRQKLDALVAARELPEALLPTKETGKKYGFNGRNVARAMVDLWRVVRDADPDVKRGGTAPKAVNFSGNLIGFRERATIDVWAARMLQRLSGGLRVPSMAEVGVSGEMRADGSTTLQFGFGQDVFSGAVKRIRKDPELKTNDTLAKINDDDLQAVVWFVEKEIWTANNWTSAAGEGGSFELEASLSGSAQQQRIRELRRAIDSSLSKPAAKAEARAELAKLERTVDRFVGGLSIQMSADTQGIEFVPQDADMARLSNEISTSIYEDESATAVLASKALSTEGRYGGIERSLDLEVVAREGYRPGALWKKMLETARDAKQDSTFLSRVLRDDEQVDPLRHRPGVEIYFREAASREKLESVLGELAKEGVEFLTVIVDVRRMTDATRGQMPPAVGVRMQYVPEFEQRYGMDELNGLDDAALTAKIQEKADEMSAMAERVAKSVGDVSFASQFWYETNVAFSHEYQEKIDAIATGTAQGAAQEVGGQEWSGQSVRAGLESANRQAREAAGSEPDGGVLGGDAPSAQEQNERIEALKELIACLGR